MQYTNTLKRFYCVMHEKRETDIWFVFRILEFEVNFGDFICVTCILYVGIVEFLNLQLRYKFG